MTAGGPASLDERILVHAPTGRDATLTRTVLEQAGLDALRCPTLDAVCDELFRGTGVILLTEEALVDPALVRLRRALGTQPPWSDVPVVMLLAAGHSKPASLRLLARLESLGNVTLLERPVRIVMLVSAMRTALRARRRQYQLRDLLEERRQVEIALRLSEASYRSLAEAMPQIVWTARADGAIDYYNQRWIDYTGATIEDTRGWGWESTVHPDDRRRTLARWREALRSGTVLDHEYRLRRAVDGSYRWHLVRAVPMHDVRGRIVRWLGTATDIDDQKRAQTTLKAARQEAEQANRAKDEFLAMLSHELRSPLGAISTWAHLLRSGKLDAARTARALETIERSTRVQAQIVEDLLDVSRIVSGKLRLEIRPVELRSVIEAAVEALGPTADAKGIALAVDLDDGGEHVAGDADRLGQVVSNLLSNAIKYTSAGGRVEVHLARTGDEIRFTVADTGQGIAPEVLPHVFDRFRQGDSAVTRRHGGLGLGLAIVRHLVELHRGRVRAESPGEGAGTTFTVTLPLALADESPLADAAAAAAAADVPAGTTGLDGVTVLLVDDDVFALESLSAALEQQGAQVITATSVADALATLDRAEPDVLVSDIAMPGEDGYSLIRRVRERPRERSGRVPAIALTAYAGAEQRQRALAAGFQKHVAKPFPPDRLVGILRGVVSRPASPAA